MTAITIATPDGPSPLPLLITSLALNLERQAEHMLRAGPADPLTLMARVTDAERALAMLRALVEGELTGDQPDRQDAAGAGDHTGMYL